MQFDARLQKMRDDEKHLDRMKHDKQYRLRFLKTQKMKISVIAEGKAGLASQIARLNARMQERERERAAEDERVKKMMKTIKRTIKGTLSEFDGGSDFDEEDDDEEDEEGEEEKEDGSGASVASVAPAVTARRTQDLAQDKGKKSSFQNVSVMAGTATSAGNVDLLGDAHSFFERHSAHSHAPSTANSDAMLRRRGDIPTTYLRYNAHDEEGRKCYIGQLHNGVRHGLGVLKWIDGSKYAGEWASDHPCGFGVEKYSDGSSYSGGFHQDLRHGFGEFEVSPGVSYCGQFEHGEMHGALYINEIISGGVAKTMPARAEKGHVFREPNWSELKDDDPRKSIAGAMEKVIAALKGKVYEAVTRARNASQDAHDVALEVSHDAPDTYRGHVSSRPTSSRGRPPEAHDILFAEEGSEQQAQMPPIKGALTREDLQPATEADSPARSRTPKSRSRPSSSNRCSRPSSAARPGRGKGDTATLASEMLPVVPGSSPSKGGMTGKECFGVLFKTWSGAGAGKGRRESQGSVDLKEFTDMLKAHKLKVRMRAGMRR